MLNRWILLATSYVASAAKREAMANPSVRRLALRPALRDLMKLMSQQTDENSPPPSITAMVSAEKITSNPFTGDEAVFESPTVKEEYEKLCRDHSNLIEMGASYANFDPSGKIAYLDEMDKIQDRWDVFFARFKLLGKLDKEFSRQCDEFLASMGMNEEQYTKLLKKTHDIMRQDAENERYLMIN